MGLIGRESKEKVSELFARHVSSGKVEFFSSVGIDFVLGKREGVYMYDLDGTRLINCHCNGGVFNLGHRNPEIVEALSESMRELDIGNHHLVSEQRALLAAELASVSPGDINRVIFGVSGGEAIDTAIKLARGHTGRPGIVSAIGGYHGHTGFALPAGDEKYSDPFRPLVPGYSRIPFGDLEALDAAVGADTAAVLLETIPATLGIAIPPEDYYEGVRRICDDRGAVMVMDEVQTGLGRCGAYWCIDTYGVVPDVIVCGKGLSGGMYPMSAVLYSDRLNRFWHENAFIHISTFGGAEVGCPVAMKVIEILERPEFLEHVTSMTAFFEKGLAELKASHPDVLLETRQRGLFMGLKMANDMCGPLMTLAGLKHGVFTIYANNDSSVSQLLPPLIIREHEAAAVLEGLDAMLTQLGQTMERST
ncbi:MAG: aminotransferase class III-fold pyridoxal phosphate-dependent enzyme [Actinobacteria bacterium]|nr:aminotransferase class III-fold pyridoxal phosphate-dependent enzyme [Actinomycetota bacterium]MBU1944866.1 aminotransferase class III-fold pyridoxal phosphate-dependent enzyme [Actinomycetota bacterium]MBU2688550.1 aminotransferase class III-fold pyridoxal phosphate-dependent enzyme [Actinomycetota bacterium]